jgi:hypothetical protein
MRYFCNICGNTKDIVKAKIFVYNGKVVNKLARCCNTYMQDITKFEGFGKGLKSPNDYGLNYRPIPKLKD